MLPIKRILCPVDLSDNSLAVVEVATMLSRQSGAKLVFLYVAPQWLPEEAMYSSDYIRATVAEDKATFQKIRPTDSSVSYEHVFVHGNPSLEIVRTAKTCDLIVMSTHGKSGIIRLLMGSVAQYVMRHASCPVISFKDAKKKSKSAAKNESAEVERHRLPQHFVTDVMHHVSPINTFDKMKEVIIELDRAQQTGAPVVDNAGCCIGILTKSDIDNYRELQERFDSRDESVINEMFETDEFGQRRASCSDFELVQRHMATPVVTISNSESCQKARELFDHNKDIHHLIVVDEAQRPLGIIQTHDLASGRHQSTGT